MAVPKSVTKVSKDGSVTFTSNVDAVQYTMRELIRGALRDCGKLLKKQYNNEFYSKLHKRTGKGGKNSSYWARSKACDLQFGVGKRNTSRTDGFYARFYEVGTSKTPKLDILRTTVLNNIAQMQNIQSQYLSALNEDNPDLSGIPEGDIEDDE